MMLSTENCSCSRSASISTKNCSISTETCSISTENCFHLYRKLLLFKICFHLNFNPRPNLMLVFLQICSSEIETRPLPMLTSYIKNYFHLNYNPRPISISTSTLAQFWHQSSSKWMLYRSVQYHNMLLHPHKALKFHPRVYL